MLLAANSMQRSRNSGLADVFARSARSSYYFSCGIVSDEYIAGDDTEQCLVAENLHYPTVVFYSHYMLELF